MLIYCDFEPEGLYDGLHELIRTAYPGAEIRREGPCAESEMTIRIKLLQNGKKISLYGEVSSGMGKMSDEKEFGLAGDVAEEHNEARKLARVFTYGLLSKQLGRDISSYGILTGVRPVKLVHRFLDRGYDAGAVLQILQKEYLLEESKARLLLEVALNDRPYLLNKDEAEKLISVYIGIPYCPSRCYYCSFPGAVLKDYESEIAPLMKAMAKEINAMGEYIKENGISVQSIYIGGGTPTVLSEADLTRLFSLLYDKYVSEATAEITVEAGRPDTLSLSKLRTLKMLGVDRVCINPQTMNDSTLKLIGRNHDEKGVVQSVEWARQAGIKKINMDLIVGLPGEDIQENTYTAKKILKLKADNLTVHTLALKRGSLMAELEGKSRIEERLREVQKGVELFSNLFREQGYIPYYMYRQKYMKANMENIAFAMQGSFCLYNIQMIEERQTIIGMGGGAASKFVQTGDWSLSSVHNPKNPKTYCESVEKLIKRKFDKLQALN